MLYFISKDAMWQKYRYDVLKKLAAYYHLSVKVLSTGRLKDYIMGGDGIETILFRSWFPRKWKPGLFPGALAYVIRNRPKMILCVANLSQFTEILALFVSRLMRIRFVWWTHGYEHGTPKMGRLKKYAWYLLYQWSDSVLTFSPQGRDYLVRMGIDEKKVICAPNTLDTEQLLRLAGEISSGYSREALANEFGFNPNDRILLFSGRLITRKKVEYAIMAVSRLIEKFPGVRLVVIGDGPEMDSLKSLADRLLPGRCSFLGSVYDESILAKVFSLADGFLMPGWVGLAIVHAFSFGLPIITERSAIHAPEIQYFREGFNGLSYDKDNVDDFAVKIEQLLTDRDLRSALSVNARKTVEEEASIKHMVTQMGLALGLERGAS